MNLKALALAVLALPAQAMAQPAQRPAPTPLAAGAAAVRDAALADTTAYEMVRSLTAEVGARPAGSAAAAKARDWGLAKLTALGFQNVHAEPFAVTAWKRGPEEGAIVSPAAQPLHVLGLGRTVPTPAGGLTGEVEAFDSYEAMLAMPPGSLAGKIVLVNQLMVRTQDGSGYGAINAARTQGASEAARRGAAAYLVRSLSTDVGEAAHTGAMRYSPTAPQIPAAALPPAEADRVAALALKGRVVVRLSLGSTAIPTAPAWNVVGEILGSTNEVVVIGGHLDSWDVGSGAVDDGAGVAITTAAAKLVGDRPGTLKRTIRVVMFGAEEIDESGAAYAAAHPAEAGHMVATSESDAGAGAIFAIRLPAGAATRPEFAALPGLLAPLKIFVDRQPSAGAGADTAGLVALGVPAFALRQDMSRYFDWHHSADDTLDKVDRAELAQNVAAWATVLYLIADSAVDLRAPAVAPARP